MKTRAEQLTPEQELFIRKIAQRPLNWARMPQSTTERLKVLFLKGEQITIQEIKEAMKTLVPEDSRLEFLELCHPLVSSTKGFSSLAKLLPAEQRNDLSELKKDDPAYHRYLRLMQTNEQRAQNYVSPISSNNSLFTSSHCEPQTEGQEPTQIRLK